MGIKDENLALTSGISLAGIAVSNFENEVFNAFDVFREEIFESIIKPNKITAIHWYLNYFQDIEQELKYLDGIEQSFGYISRVLREVNMIPNLRPPKFEECDSKWHQECDCDEILEEWKDFIKENCIEINELIIHSAFQMIFQDRRFLHDFHNELSDYVEDYIDDIKEMFPDNITLKNRIKRSYFPKWLTNAVFFRDKGTCVLCRCDLSNLIRSQNTIHIDHIVPLDNFGSNDATNFQLLCESCNTKKGARSSETNSVNVPFWNNQ